MDFSSKNTDSLELLKQLIAIPSLSKNEDAVSDFLFDFINKKGEYVTNELYNSKTDPDENENVAGYEENKKIIKDLSNQLMQGWKSALPKIE